MLTRGLLEKYFNTFLIKHFTDEELKKISEVLPYDDHHCPCSVLGRSCHHCINATLEHNDNNVFLSSCRSSIFYQMLFNLEGMEVVYMLVDIIKKYLTENQTSITDFKGVV